MTEKDMTKTQKVIFKAYITFMKKVHKKDYSKLSEEEKEQVCDEFIKECLEKKII